MSIDLNTIRDTELLYEIALSIGNSLHMDIMMRQCVGTLLRVLNANGCVVLSHEPHPAAPQTDQAGHASERLDWNTVISLPRRFVHEPEIINLIEQLRLPQQSSQLPEWRRSLPISLNTGSNFRYVLGLPGFGLLLLQKHTMPLSHELLLSLNNLLEKLASAALACRYEQALQHQINAAQTANIAKNQFLANISHEIRTPLNAIIGLSELQLNADLPPPIQQRNQHIHHAGELLLDIVDDLLELSNIEAGHLSATVAATPFNLDALLNQLATLFTAPSRQKNLELLVRRQPEIPEWYIIDLRRLKKVLTKLLANAIKFTEQGRVELHIGARQFTPDHARLVFTVSDTGIGMTPEQQRDLFQAFSQGDTSTTRRHGGAGLGLVISQRLVQLMGGEGIRLHSQAGRGSEFEFELQLPLAAPPAPSNAPDTSADPWPASAACFGGQQVLVVEDQRINQYVIQSQLEQIGLQVSLANHGAEGIEQLKHSPFDLVLMDIQMPVMDGYQATREIRQFNTEIPIIALTAADLVEDRHKALAAGMNDHLGKPFTGRQLFECLRPWLSTSATRIKADDPQPTALISAAQPPLEHKPTLMIVDDMAANIKMLANLLKADYHIQAAKTGHKALEMAQSHTPPDLILLDVKMPDMDGYEVCNRLKNHAATSRIPVIFVTAMDEVRDQTHGLSLGAVDYITKPFHAEIVRARVKTHMTLKHQNDQLETLSHIDGLTQVANRRCFDQALRHEIKRHSRNGRPLGLIILDIDFFKPFNDHYGHGKGDECLVQVATTLQAVIKRPSDLFARYGGEEFVALLPDTTQQGVLQIAEAMRQAVINLNFPHAYSQVADHVTISIGCVSQTVATTTTPEDVLNTADSALYAAKRQGRNQVAQAS